MRLALALVLLFAIVSAVALGATWAVMRGAIGEGLVADLRLATGALTAAPDARSLAVAVEAATGTADPERRLAAFTAPDGRLVGDARLAGTWTGTRVVALDRGATEGDGTYLVAAEAAHGGRLAVAVGREAVSDLDEAFRNVLLFALLPAVALALGGAAWLARREGWRVEVIAATLDRLAAGDLGARVDAGGSPEGDDLARIAARVDRMAAAQEASVAALRSVSVDIAHDLRTPVQRVRLLLEDLAGRLPPDGEEARLAGRALDEADGAVAIFATLLQIATVEAGALRDLFVPVDLAGLASKVVEVYAPAAEDGGRVLVLDAPDGAVVVAGEPTLLQQLLANLVENALRHTPPSSRVALRVAMAGAGPEIVVADDGPGIPAPERPLALRRFWRADRSRTGDGHGLGLSLVAAVAALHGAALALEDNEPGLRVRLSFPCR